MRSVLVNVPLIVYEGNTKYIALGKDGKNGRSSRNRRGKSSNRYRCTGSLLLLLVLFSVTFVAGFFAILSSRLGLKKRFYDSEKRVRDVENALAFEHGKPSQMCHSFQPAMGDLYKRHWQKAFALFRNHAPKSVLKVMPEFGTETRNFYTNTTREEILLKYLRVSYSTFFPGFAVVRSWVTRRGTHYVFYSRIYKAGNDAIRENLAKASHSRARLMYRIYKGAPSKTFTFVREPAERWIAGYNELEHRWGVENTYNVSEKCPGCIFHTFPLGQERVWAFLGDLLLMKLAKAYEIEHVYPMSGILRASKALEFIGRIENFEQDWDTVLNVFIGPISDNYKFDHSLGVHNSSGYEAQQHGMRLLEHNPFFTEILQHILFKDYACFGYPLRVPMDKMIQPRK